MIMNTKPGRRCQHTAQQHWLLILTAATLAAAVLPAWAAAATAATDICPNILTDDLSSKAVTTELAQAVVAQCGEQDTLALTIIKLDGLARFAGSCYVAFHHKCSTTKVAHMQDH